jgi:hypothetical protein
MAKKGHWKTVERTIAKRLGGKRVPITGRQRGDVPDIDHHYFSIEVKQRDFIPKWLFLAIEQAEAAKKGKQKPVGIWHITGEKYDDALCIMRLKDFEEILKGYVASL